MTFILESLCVRIKPSVEEAENIILEKIMKEYEGNGSEKEITSKAQIVQRRLQVILYF